MCKLCPRTFVSYVSGLYTCAGMTRLKRCQRNLEMSPPQQFRDVTLFPPAKRPPPRILSLRAALYEPILWPKAPFPV
jgi:hypothetical protein